MRPPTTNTAVLTALVIAGVTGLLAYGVGAPTNRWITLAHGVAGLSLLVLTPAKSVVVRRGWRRRRAARSASAWLIALVGLVVATGIAHSVGVRTLGPLTTMQAHVGAAVAVVPLLAAHLVTRPGQLRAVRRDRRALLRAGGIVGLAALAWATLEGGLRLTSARGARRRFTGSHEVGSFAPARMPVTQWFDDDPPGLDAAVWRLEVADTRGSRHVDLDGLREHPARREALVALDCTGGWYAEQRWTGTPLAALLDVADARSVLVTSATGYARRFPVRDLSVLLLADAAGGAPLSDGHGAPVRLVAPGRRGFWWVKWVVRVEASPRPWWLQSPFPLT